MVDRKDFGSWLEGPPQLNTQSWPGKRLGLPESGTGSVARFGRRVVALAIDWAVASAIAYGFFGGADFAILSIFAAEQILLVGTLGFSIGHRLVGIRVQKMDGSPAGPVPAIVRTLLLCLVIPALLADSDQRGLHDRAMGTVLVRS